jgi:hypothetical protein
MKRIPFDEFSSHIYSTTSSIYFRRKSTMRACLRSGHRRTSIATVRTTVSTSRVLEEPHEADGVQIIHNSVLGQLLPLYECSVAERSKPAYMREMRDAGTSVDVRIRYRRDTCYRILLPTERQRSSQAARPVAD